MTTHRLYVCALVALLLVVALPSASNAQCGQASINDPPDSYQTCSGSNTHQIRSTTKTFNMSSSVSCMYNGYFGGSAQSSATLGATGECGNAATGTPPECWGYVSGASSIGDGVWQVTLATGYFDNVACQRFSEHYETISIPVESCTGYTCCSTDAESACVHNGGLFSGCFCGFSPIIVSLDEGGLRLTGAEDGVKFDLYPDGLAESIAWTRGPSIDAFLALDRNQNGVIDDGKELFGSVTSQPASQGPRNGFNALAVFDANGDRRIDRSDMIFGWLRLWTDGNHNGASEPGELQTLTAAGVESISLEFRSSGKKDGNGNTFRFVSRVTLKRNGKTVERALYDVFLANK